MRSGPFDILVNNAGALGATFQCRKRRQRILIHLFSITCAPAYFVAKSVAAGMVEAGRPGVIIQISSQMGHVGAVSQTVYSERKHAIEGLTKSMAIELGRHQIRVNSIAPTFIKTKLSESTLADPVRRAWIDSKIKLAALARLRKSWGRSFSLPAMQPRRSPGPAS